MIIDDMPELDDQYRDPDHWFPPKIEILPPSFLATLKRPKFRARRCGVYFLFTGDSDRSRGHLVYVGVSDNVFERVRIHRGQRKMRFDFATYMPVPWGWHFAIEALYIREYKPTYNLRLSETVESDFSVANCCGQK